jgi:hypothetical protein
MIFRIFHLFYCLKNLGIIQGFRYWRLTLQATGDSTFVSAWANGIRNEANKEDVMKRHVNANSLRLFADELERFNALYHKHND